MARQQFPLDRSAAFTCLLDLDPDYGAMEVHAGEQRVTDFLADWYQSDSTDMYAFCREWLNSGKDVQ